MTEWKEWLSPVSVGWQNRNKCCGKRKSSRHSHFWGTAVLSFLPSCTFCFPLQCDPASKQCRITLTEGEANVELSLIIKPLSSVEGHQVIYPCSRNIWSHRVVRTVKTTAGHLMKALMFWFCHQRWMWGTGSLSQAGLGQVRWCFWHQTTANFILSKLSNSP